MIGFESRAIRPSDHHDVVILRQPGQAVVKTLPGIQPQQRNFRGVSEPDGWPWANALEHTRSKRRQNANPRIRQPDLVRKIGDTSQYSG